MNDIFESVVEILVGISQITGLSYNEVNIIVYYIIIPFSWTVLLDKIFKFHYFKISFSLIILGFLLFIKDYYDFCDWLFEKSADFLLSLGDYIIMSVIVCVFLVIIVYMVLIYFAYLKKIKWE